MDSSRWQRVQTLFHEAADLPAAEQLEFLEKKCSDDEALVSEVLILLQEDSRGGSLLERDVAHVAHQVLGESPSDAAPFKEFGPYRIIRALGEGGMGMVYLAEREDLGSRVAIKVLRDAWLSPARRERFATEQRTLAQLNHPSIARLYDADTSPDGTPFFAMEFVEGIPLTEYCRQHNCSIAERLRLFREVCEAVLYAHQHAVIHRDLKPSNILVKDDGSVRLLDFGIAKHLQSLGEAVDQTMTGLRLMTPAYAAPEQIRGEQVGIQSDVYSLGVVLYELLAGRLPFDLSNRTPAQAEKILTEQVAQRPSEVAAKASDAASSAGGALQVSKAAWADLDVLCLTAMHKDAQQRYQSVEALIRDIDHYLKGEPLEARPDTLRYRARKFATRNWRAVSAVAAVIAVVVGLVVFFTLRLARERDNANRQTAIATTINQFLSDDLLGRGNPFQSGKAAETLLDAIKVASPSIDRKFKDEPQVAARLHLTIAQALDNRTNYPEARGEYERAHQLFLQTEGPLSQDAIVVQLQRAAMEARSYQSGGLPVAKSLLAEQEALIPKVKNPRNDLPVWLYSAKGMIALIENDAKAANQNFKAASDAAMLVPDFDETARFNLRQRLAFTYIRLGDGATAERLARELIVAYAGANGSDSPYESVSRLERRSDFCGGSRSNLCFGARLTFPLPKWSLSTATLCGAGCGSASSCRPSRPAPIRRRWLAARGGGTVASHAVLSKFRSPARPFPCVFCTRHDRRRCATSGVNAAAADRSLSFVPLRAPFFLCSIPAPSSGRARTRRSRALPSLANFDWRKIRSQPTPAAVVLHIGALLLPPAGPRSGYRSCSASPAAPR